MRRLRHIGEKLIQAYESTGDLVVVAHLAGEDVSLCPPEVGMEQWQDMVDNPDRYIVTTTSGKLTISKVEENSHGSS